MKVDYQVTPALMQQLAMEYIKLRPPEPLLKRLRLPILVALIFAVLGAFEGGSTISDVSGHVYRVTMPVAGVAIGGAVGFALGLLGNALTRSRVLSVVAQSVLNSAASSYGSRTFSWTESGVSFTSPIALHEWKWPAIDEIQEGSIGVHFLWKKSLLGSVPKSVLPAEAQPDKLRELMRAYTPPLINSPVE